MSWFSGNGEKDTTSVGEDPLKVAAQEMAATIAVHAKQKVDMVKSGLGGLAGGAAPSPGAIMAALNGGSVPAADPYAGLSRDEKIALIGQLQKAKVEREQMQKSEAQDDDLVDPTAPSVPLTKAFETKEPGQAPEPKDESEKEESDDEEEDKDEEKPESTSDDDGDKLEKGLDLLDDLIKSDGEGSKGGHVIGHTSSGKPIYDSNSSMVSSHWQASQGQHGKPGAHGELATKMTNHMKKQSKGFSVDDHKDAAAAHKKRAEEVRSDKTKGKHQLARDDKAKLHMRLAAQHEHAAGEVQKSVPELNDFIKSEGEGSRGGKIIGHTSSGKPIYAGPGKDAVYDKTVARRETIPSFRKRHKGWTPEDHKEAEAAHKEAEKKANEEAAKHKAWSPEWKMANNHYHRGMAANHMEEAGRLKRMGKSMSSEDLNDFIQKSESQKEQTMENPNDILNDFISKSEGQGGMPASDVPSAMPTTRRPADGGDVEEAGKVSGAQSPAATTVASTSGGSASGGEDLQAKTPKDKDLEDEAGGEKLSKSDQWVDWNQAADQGEYLKAQLVNQLLNKSMDVKVGYAGKIARPEVKAPEPKLPNVYFQKGGSIAYVDSEDQRIEKAMQRAGGHTTFSQGSQANFGAPIQHETACTQCDAMVKSYLSSCTECGTSLHGVQLQESQGLSISKSVATSLVPGSDDDILIG